MGLFGALFAGVSGLDSQSNKIGIISNNISNVNTVGFKQGQASFDTLVVPSGTTTFSPGGVIGNTQNLVNQQGLIQATTSATDAAITGGGFFVVNTKADGTGTQLFTRAGSFTQDANGNFRNANGFFLQGLLIQPNGKPLQPSNRNLSTVKVSQSATGTATATSTMTIGANLNAAQSVLLGNGVTATLATTNGTSTVNTNLTSNQMMVGNNFPGTGISAANNLLRGQTFSITNGSNPPKVDTFTYGGFTVSRDITSAVAAGDGDGGNTLQTFSNQTNPFSMGAGSNVITVTSPSAHNYVTGQSVDIQGVVGTIDGIPASQLNGNHLITVTGANTFTFTTVATATLTQAGIGGPGISYANRSFPFTGNVLNATSTTTDFLANGASPLTPSTFASDSLKFSITVGGNTPSFFTYSTTPDPTHGTFSNLTSLATAINNTAGLTARIVNSRLYVSATDANQQVIFANGDANGSGGLPGINWIQELDLGTLAGGTTGVYNSLAGLAAQINVLDPTNLVATVNNPNSSATLAINEANPQQTITFTDGSAVGSPLKELGIPNLSGTAPFTTGVLPIVYNPSSATSDMSSGAVASQFSHDITVFDAQGNGHTLTLNFVKLGTNTWGVELTAVPLTDITSSVTSAKFPAPTGDGQIANGIITFKGDGTISSVTGNIANASIPINWTNGANASSISVDLGVGNTASGVGLTQAAGPFNVSVASQNGSPTGQLTGVTIDSNGFIVASFSNGQTQQLYQVPLANVTNPNGLQGVSGDAYQQTLDSGIPNLQFAGTSGVGAIASSALEQSNVDLSTQLTNLIVAQQAYGANSKLLTVSSQLLQELDQIIQ